MAKKECEKTKTPFDDDDYADDGDDDDDNSNYIYYKHTHRIIMQNTLACMHINVCVNLCL